MIIMHAKRQQNDDLRGNEQSSNEVFYSWHVNISQKIIITSSMLKGYEKYLRKPQKWKDGKEQEDAFDFVQWK